MHTHDHDATRFEARTGVWVCTARGERWEASRLVARRTGAYGHEAIEVRASDPDGRAVTVRRGMHEWGVVLEAATLAWCGVSGGEPARGQWGEETPVFVPAVAWTERTRRTRTNVMLGVPGGGAIELAAQQGWAFAKWVTRLEREEQARTYGAGLTLAPIVAQTLRLGGLALVATAVLTGTVSATVTGWTYPLALATVLGLTLGWFEWTVRDVVDAVAMRQRQSFEQFAGWRRTLAHTIRLGRHVQAEHRRREELLTTGKREERRVH